MNKTALRGNILLIVLVFIAVLIAAVTYFKLYQKIPQITQNKPTSIQEPGKKDTESDQLKSYTSRNLQIAFTYSKGWYIDDQYPFILVTNYPSSLNQDQSPRANQIEILISIFNGCHNTIEENLIDPACGEGGSSVSKNKIISKEMRQTDGGNFYKYIVETPNKNFTYHLFAKGDQVLQIEKHPDPSQFEKEFEEIIDSIKFL